VKYGQEGDRAQKTVGHEVVDLSFRRDAALQRQVSDLG